MSWNIFPKQQIQYLLSRLKVAIGNMIDDIHLTRTMTIAQFDQLTPAQKKGWIDTTDEGFTPTPQTRILDLSDVAVIMPVNGQVLTYDSSTGKWVNADNLQIVNNLTTDDATKVLSAAQGKALKDITDTIPQVVNDVTTGGTTKALSAEQGKNLNTAVKSS